MNIFIGNLSPQTTEKQIENLFIPFGEVKAVKIVIDNFTKRSRNFGFVDMPEKENAEKAIEKLNNTSFNSQSIVVNEARLRNNNEPYNSFGRRSY
ncbi:MAG TPA: hypothetical protein VN721_06630 [Flavipsychrobacter sp.]|nr:hypothetical protein [Flavipsychrobacter sp.]